MQHRPVEVERKWLVQDLPDLSGHESKEVIQGYIAIATDGTEVRLRQTGGKFFQTVKSEGGLVRDEIEIDLTQDQFEALWRATAGRRLKKTRYTWQWEGQTVEIDVYHGSLRTSRSVLTKSRMRFHVGSYHEVGLEPCGSEGTFYGHQRQ